MTTFLTSYFENLSNEFQCVTLSNVIVRLKNCEERSFSPHIKRKRELNLVWISELRLFFVYHLHSRIRRIRSYILWWGRWTVRVPKEWKFLRSVVHHFWESVGHTSGCSPPGFGLVAQSVHLFGGTVTEGRTGSVRKSTVVGTIGDSVLTGWYGEDLETESLWHFIITKFIDSNLLNKTKVSIDYVEDSPFQFYG